MAAQTIKFGTVETNVSTLPTNLEDFKKLYKGKIPNIKAAWNEVKKVQKKAK